MANKGGGAWDEIRRVLGRWAGKTPTHRVDTNQLRLQTIVFRTPTLGKQPANCGLQEAVWPLTAATKHLPAPIAPPGDRNTNLAVVAALTSRNEAVPASARTVRSVSLHSACSVQSLPLCAPIGAQTYGEPLALRSKSISHSASLVNTVHWKAVMGFRIGRPQVKTGLPTLAQVPFTRRRSLSPIGQSSAEAFAREHAYLSQATGVPEEDIVLIGVYARVPLSCARRLSVSPDGAALLLWLNPQKAKQAAPRLVTVIIGRQISTGKALQAVSLPPHAEQRP